MLLSMGVVGLAPLTFSNKQKISQLSTIVKRDLRRLSTTVNALKRDQADMSAIVDALKRDQDNIRQLSNTVDALKRELDSERNRTITLEQRFNGKTLPSCPEGYIMWRGICYKAFNTSKTFSEAGAACRADGGTLAMPRDAETNAFLISLYMSVRDEFFFWIGLHDRCEEGRFEWVDGSALGPYSAWGQGQPSNNQVHSDCVAYSGYLSPCLKDKWYDAPCDAQYYYICQTVPGILIVST
ncbi:alpha-N-acetylgalactosamine-specific lectin-like [Branchiostoma floridae x Branchiostoma belcheri]